MIKTYTYKSATINLHFFAGLFSCHMTGGHLPSLAPGGFHFCPHLRGCHGRIWGAYPKTLHEETTRKRSSKFPNSQILTR